MFASLQICSLNIRAFPTQHKQNYPFNAQFDHFQLFTMVYSYSQHSIVPPHIASRSQNHRRIHTVGSISYCCFLECSLIFLRTTASSQPPWYVCGTTVLLLLLLLPSSVFTTFFWLRNHFVVARISTSSGHLSRCCAATALQPARNVCA